MDIYNFPDHTKGDTFKGRDITLNFDITGAVIRMHFKSEGIDKVVFKWETTDNTFLVIDALTGKFRMESRILNFTPRRYIYDLEVTDSNGSVMTYLEGSIKITQDIT